ncbi:MAG: recombinase family protein [Anaerolineae bacterium]
MKRNLSRTIFRVSIICLFGVPAPTFGATPSAGAENGHSLDAQRNLITDFVQARGWTLVTVFSDIGFSGAHGNRPALQALLERAAQGDFDVVIVHALDRFYRSLPHLLPFKK